MEIILNNLQSLKAFPTAVIVPDIKAVNALFRKPLPLIPFEPSIATKHQQIIMDDLLHYLLADTFTYFTTNYHPLQDDPYILKAIQEATSSH